jgi:DNA polymerase-3 subunit gamma/tau
LDYIDRLHQESKDMARLCDELLDHFRSLMLIKTTRNPQKFIVMSAEEFELAQTQADYLTLAEIVYIMDVLQVAYQRMGKGNSNRTELEMALVKLSSTELDGSTEALVARVSALEKAIRTGNFAQQNVVEAKPQVEKSEPPVEEKPKPVENVKEEPVAKTEEAPVEEIPLPSEPEPPKEIVQTPAPVVKSEPVQKPTVSANLDEIYENAKPFRQWPEVVENIKLYSKAIAAAFSNTNAYESGSYLLIEADSEIPFKLLKEGSQRANVRKAIQEITGKVYKLGPYRKPEKNIEKADPLKDFINGLKDSGVNITEE